MIQSLRKAFSPCDSFIKKKKKKKKKVSEMKEEGVKHKKKVFINDSYSTSRSSEVEEVNGFSGTLKNASMSVSAR